MTTNDSSERVTGLRRVFSVPSIYRFTQWALGASAMRDHLVSEVFNVAEHERILDIGCGTADILDHLPDVDYVGFDHSERYVADASARYGERGRFLAATANAELLENLDPRTLVISIGVLHHLSDTQVVEALLLARRTLSAGGRFVSVDPTFADGQSAFGRLLASRDRGQHVRSPEQTQKLLEGVFPRVAISIRHDLLRIPYSHVIAEATLSEDV